LNDRVVIFGREPVAGRVKTRLASAVGAEAAARVYAVLLEHAIQAAVAAGVDVILSLAEPPSPAWAAPVTLRHEVQSGVDLGRRMAECFHRGFHDGAGRVVIAGSDIARVTSRHLQTAVGALDRHPVVLGPAEDGGYWLVGQRAPGVDLFTEIPWSRAETLEFTRSRLKAHGLDWHELETLPDIDTARDLQRALIDPQVDEELRRRLQLALGQRFE
jgi:rSAM/selenodomain-associated transferase 1